MNLPCSDVMALELGAGLLKDFLVFEVFSKLRIL